MICLIYVARLGRLQFSPEADVLAAYDGESYTRTVSIQALRGNICDRNGTILVTNRDAYRLLLDYDALPAARETNALLLRIDDAIDRLDPDSRTEDYFPFEGDYPNLTLSAETRDEESTVAAKWASFLATYSSAFREGDVAEEAVRFLAKKYKMLDADGNPRFSEQDMTRLIRLRYDMEVKKFSSIQPYLMAEDVSMALIGYLKELSLPGLLFPKSEERQYVYPGYASHILGRVGKIYAENLDYYLELGYSMDELVGISGCEYAFEEYLRGQDGVLVIRETADGKLIDCYVEKEPVPGQDVYLTIDIDVQIAAEDALRENVTSTSHAKNPAGAATAIDPQTGQILAIASYPTYDLSTFNADYGDLSSDPALPLLNRAFGNAYAPGSTFKLGMAAAALQEGVISATDKIRCTGVYTYGAPKCNNHALPMYLNVTEAITYSCNCYFCDVGERLGINRMNEYCRQLGLGEPTGIELSEVTGILAGESYYQANHLGAWSGAMTAQAAIGQAENLFTPLQLSVYVATLTNGGTRYRAHLLHSVRSASGETVLTMPSKVLGTVTLRPAVLSTVKTGMRSMVTGSTTATRHLRGVPVTVGGKSGTAQVGSGTNALFTAAAPLDTPRIVASCIVEGGTIGSQSAMTVGAIMSAFFAE